MMSPPVSVSSSNFSSTTNLTTPWPEKKPPRQRPGLACESCRSRKLRCDGQQPQCGSCFEADVECITTNTGAPRGPRKGHMKALQTRLLKLEQQLAEKQQEQEQQISFMPDMIDTSADSSFNLPAIPPPLSTPFSPEDAAAFNSGYGAFLLDAPACAFMTDLQRADLDQVYFERAHPFVPILNQRFYKSWARQANNTEPQICLQYAMWTLAASLSAQTVNMPQSLYDTTRRRLESLEANDSHFTKSNDPALEHVQARVLLFIYEFLQTNPHRGWMSSGRCFRLLQLMRLSEIDTPENTAKRFNDPDSESWVRTEEKRRTFWIAYSLDRFISLLNEWPLMLNEHTICTRLPATEEDFRAGYGAEMPFLSEAMIVVEQTKSSSFTEVIILATICGRAITHQQQSRVDQGYTNNPQHFWDRHQWLDDMLKVRAEIFHKVYPCLSDDTMLLFANMILHTTVVCLGKALESVKWGPERQGAIIAFRERCFGAAKEIVGLSRSLADISYFKVDPFTPLSLILCVEFFNSHRYLDESVEPRIQEVYSVLREMGTVNNLAQNYFN